MFIAWRDLLHARGRFALMAGVIMLIAMLVGLLSGLTAGLSRDSTSAVTNLHTNYLTFSGTTASFSTSQVPIDVADRSSSPLGFSTQRVSNGAHTIAAAVSGTEPDSAVTPQAAGIADGTVVLTDKAATDLQAERGSSVEIGGHDFVVGAVRGADSLSHSPVIWMTLDNWQQLTRSGSTATVLARDVNISPPGMTTLTLSDSVNAIASHASENGSLQLIRGFLFGISALIVGAFFTVWTVQRSRDIAVLKALGASSRYLLRDAIGQGAVLLAVGTAMGAVVAWGASLLAEGRVPFVFDFATGVVPLLVLDLIGIIGAALAVRRLTSVDPLTALGAAR